LNVVVDLHHVLVWVVDLTIMALIHEMPFQAKNAAHWHQLSTRLSMHRSDCKIGHKTRPNDGLMWDLLLSPVEISGAVGWKKIIHKWEWGISSL